MGRRLALVLVVCLGSARTALAAELVIRELLLSHVGIDDAEYVELGGAPGAELTGTSLIVVEGDAGAVPGRIDRRIDFRPDHQLGSDGSFLLGNCEGLPARYGVVPDRALRTNSFENSSLTAALVETPSLAGWRVTGRERVLDAIALSDGDPADAFFFGAAVVGPDGPFFPAGARRSADGWELLDFEHGGANSPRGGGHDGCAPKGLAIAAIQGTRELSAYEDERARTLGVVTLARGREVWLQDPAPDADARSSDAILVTGASTLRRLGPGDYVRVEARVSERAAGNGLPVTELADVSRVEVLASGRSVPEPVRLENLPDVSLEAAIDFWERIEGMRVLASSLVVVGPRSSNGRIALLALRDARPGSGYFPQTGQLLLRPLTRGRVDYNPERIFVDVSRLAQAPPLRPGDRIERLEGVVDYAFGSYEIQPENTVVGARSSRAALPRRPRLPVGTIAVATWNLGNLFDLEDDPERDDEVPSAQELDTKLSKLALAIEQELELPQILVVQEIENAAVLSQLAERLNSVAGAAYAASSSGSSDPRGIEVGLLFDTARVELLEAGPLAGPSIEAAFGSGSSSPGREPLFGRFRVGAQELLIVGLHLVSKLRDEPLFALDRPARRASEGQRAAQARAVRAFVNERLADDPGALLLVAGDLNDFEFAEPGEGDASAVGILEGALGPARLFDLLRLARSSERFTYVHDGNAQALDHLLASPALRPRVVRVEARHFNASEPLIHSSDPGTPLRASDHDPLIAHLRLPVRPRRPG